MQNLTGREEKKSLLKLWAMSNKNKILIGLSVIFLIWAIIVLRAFFKEHSVYFLFFEIYDTVLLDILFVFYFGVIAYYCGAAFIRLSGFGRIEQNFFFRLVVNSTVGFGVIAIVTFFIGLFGLYYNWVFLVLHLILLMIAFPEIKRTLDWTQQAQLNFNPILNIQLYKFFLIVLLLFLILMRLCYGLVPPFGDDAQWYHLGIPLDYLSAKKFTPKWDKPAAAFPANFEMLNIHCLSLSSDISVAFLNFYIGILLLLGIYFFLRKFISDRYALLLTLLFYSDPTMQFLNLEIKNDQFLILSIMLSVYFFFAFWENKETKFLNLTAIFWGIALGTKYTALNIVIFLILGVVFVVKSEIKQNIGKIFLKMFILMLIFSAPWYIKNMIVYKNPIAPFYKKMFTWLQPKDSSSGTSISQPTKQPASNQPTDYVDLVRFYGMGRNFTDYLKLPWNVTVYGKRGTSRFDSTITPLYLALFPFIFFGIRDKKVIFLFIMFVIQFSAWALQESQNSRYLAISFPLLIFLIGYGLVYLNLEKIKKIIVLIIGISAALFIFTEFLFFVHTDAQPYRFIFSLETRDDYLKRAAGPLYEASVFLKKEWAGNKNIKAYFIGTRSNYFFRESSVADYNLRFLSQIVNAGKTPEGIKEFFKIRRINHILIEYKMLQFFYTRSEKRKQELFDFLKFRDTYLKQKFFKEGLSQVVGVYELSDEPIR